MSRYQIRRHVTVYIGTVSNKYNISLFRLIWINLITVLYNANLSVDSKSYCLNCLYAGVLHDSNKYSHPSFNPIIYAFYL